MSRADELAVELEWSRSEVRELKARLAATEHERDALRTQRDNAAEHAAGLGRILRAAGTPEDVIAVLCVTLLDAAQEAPNCIEWEGTHGGRGFRVSVQWADGKSLHTLIDEARAERDAARANAEHEANDVVALRAIIEGRTVPPTDAEIAAHHAAGGRWRCLVPNRLWQSKDAMHDSTARIQRATLEVDGGPAVWWSIDSTGRPCAWPVVPPKDGAQ